MKQRLIHSGNLSYLNKVHRGYGTHRYWMKYIKRWADGKITVEFIERENETQEQGTAEGT